MESRERRTPARFALYSLALAVAVALGWAAPGAAAVNVITVDCTPLVSPGGSSFGPTNTMGMALLAVDQGGDFAVTEVTPAAFRAMNAAQLAAFDLIAVNNNPARLGDFCVAGAGAGLGTTWQGVVGVASGGRVVLTSHDAPRFKLLRTPPAAPLFTGFEPFGTVDFVRQTALWAGGVPGLTGLLIFNDAARLTPGVGAPIGGQGWDNPELNLPAAWGITDLDQSGGTFMNGGYTDILPAFATHPIYDGTAVGGGILSDVRGAFNTLSSFSANIGDTSFHSVFNTFNAAIFTPTEVVVNAGVLDVLGLCFCSGNDAAGPNGKAITLIRDAPPCPCFDAAALSQPPLFGTCRAYSAWASGYTQYLGWPFFSGETWMNGCWFTSPYVPDVILSPITPVEYQVCRQTLLDAATNAGVSCLVW